MRQINTIMGKMMTSKLTLHTNANKKDNGLQPESFNNYLFTYIMKKQNKTKTFIIMIPETKMVVISL